RTRANPATTAPGSRSRARDRLIADRGFHSPAGILPLRQDDSLGSALTAPGGMTPSAPPEPLLAVILGPTASGKTALAISLAQKFRGEIVSCDSVAVYRHFEIGTAKPTPGQRSLVPHHLLDVAEPDEPFTAGEYSRQARAAIAGIASRGKLPIVVGGTG